MPRIAVTFSLQEVEEIERDCAIYRGRMERIAKHSAISREEQVTSALLPPSLLFPAAERLARLSQTAGPVAVMHGVTLGSRHARETSNMLVLLSGEPFLSRRSIHCGIDTSQNNTPVCPNASLTSLLPLCLGP